MTSENTPDTAADATTGGEAPAAAPRRRRATRTAAPAAEPTTAETTTPSADGPVEPAAPAKRRTTRRTTRATAASDAAMPTESPTEPAAAAAEGAPAGVAEAAPAAAAPDAPSQDAPAAPAKRSRARRATAPATAAPEATAAAAPVSEPTAEPAPAAAAPTAEEGTETKTPARRRRATSRTRAAAEPAPAEPAVEPTPAQPTPAQDPEAEPAEDETEETAQAPALDVLAELATVTPAEQRAPQVGTPRLATTALLFQAPDPSARPRRRRVQASAGSPEEISDAARRAAEAEAAEQAAQAPTAEQPAAAQQPAAEQASGSRSGRRRGGRRGRGSAPEETAEGAAEATEASTEDAEAPQDGTTTGSAPQDARDDAPADVEPDETETEDGEQDAGDGQGAPRRRRRRGGRGRRNRGEQADAASEEDAEADEPEQDEPESSADEAETDNGGGSSRRRRRRRRGSRGDEGEARAGRTAGDEVTALRGSTRLEAKRQRRREGRDAGRRRQIITEAEFLARRESVERSMIVRERNGRTQIAVLEDGVLVEHYVSNQAQASMVGNVYLGRVQNVLPSMEAAFVDVGKGRNAVLYAGEVNWDAAGLEGQPRRIEQALKSGDSVLVQVTKDPIGHKGARLTSQITLAGRYLVYVPGGGMTGISRKLPDTERSRLKRILREIVPDSAGVIVRTAAEGASEEELRADIARLQGQWEAIEKKAKSASAPALLQGEPDMAIRVVRDIFNDDFSSLVVQGRQAWGTISSYIAELAPDLAEKVTQWTSETDVFAVHRIDEQLAKGMDRKVWLPSGGSLVIDRTEAMTVIDVNTGKFTGSGGTLEETVTRNNLEAAEEIVRQLRLRDIGGIIVIDFIDMVLESNRDLVLRRLVECLGRDRTKHQVAEVTSLGLVQMTRKRVGQGLVEAFSETCEHCHGRGFIVHDEPVEKNPRPEVGAAQAAPENGEPKRSRRKRGGAKEPVASAPHAGVPVLPEEREAVKATLATIAAAAAHAHEHGEPEDGVGQVPAPGTSSPQAAPVPVVSAPEDEPAPLATVPAAQSDHTDDDRTQPDHGPDERTQDDRTQDEQPAATSEPSPTTTSRAAGLDVLAELAPVRARGGRGRVTRAAAPPQAVEITAGDERLELTPVAPEVFADASGDQPQDEGTTS